jgi:hypothetical protein
MSDKVVRSLKKLFKKIEDTLDETIKREQMISLGNFTANLIRKRTRLGYGVDRQFGVKQKLKPLSPRYVSARKKFKDLSNATTPKKSNLTLTGQMLDSVKIIKAENGSIKIGPTGNRTDNSFSNLQIALFNQNKGRTFNRVSQLEGQQVLREFRRSFGDLLKKRKLIT